LYISADDPLAIAVVEAIRTGNVVALKQLLSGHPGLATARIGSDDPARVSRTLLHIATDWPGHFPNGKATVAALIEAGAEVNARFSGPHVETPLHWAASTNDVDVLKVLIDSGADLEAPGGVIGGGPPLADATAFGQWEAALELVKRGARTTLWDAATLGLMDRLEAFFEGEPPKPEDVTKAFWGACHGGQRPAAEYLLSRGADINWVPGWEQKTPLDAARRSKADELAEWLCDRGAKTAR
jgi:hypothetical protein